jgi:hypothetical protein
MRRLLLMVVACVGSTVAATVLTALLTVRAYWGHWFGPPRADRTAAEAVSVDRYSAFRWDGTATSGPAALAEQARWKNDGLGESPTGRLPAALLRRGLSPARDDPVPSGTLDAVRDLLTAEGYPVTNVRAEVAEGWGTDGTRVVLAAVFGPEPSNDHRPYYEVAAAVETDGRLRPLRVTHYRYDVAGLEGLAHLLAAIPVAALCTLAWGCLFLGHLASSHRTARCT